MLPNWLYGKSKSKLASILGGGGGIPEDYNQVKAQVTQNAEDILSLSDALDDKAALTQISNPNLLDNPWFTVNQRGETSSYFADRWVRFASELTFTNNDGVTISGTPSSIENLGTHKIEWDRLKDNIGKTITLSVLIDGTIYKAAGEIKTPGSSWTTHVTLNIPSLNIAFQLLTNGASPSIAELVFKNINTDAINITIRAVKLELGSVSTLAMDTAPNYATELLKCQRYFIGGKLESLYAYKASGRINAFMLLPVTMRSAPVIVGTAGVYSLDDNSAVSGASIESPLELYSNGVKFPISGANDTLCRVFIASGSGLSADL